MGTGCEIRRQLTIAATKAKPTATYIQTGILSVAEVTLKIKATNVVPSVCPSSRAVPTVRPTTPGTRGGRYHRTIIRGLEQAEAHTAKHQSPSDVHIGGLPRQ